jgi:NAD(P)H-dependent FMN reductase
VAASSPDHSSPLFIPVVLGSIRKSRRSLGPARLLVERVAAAGHETQLVDLRQMTLPMYDEEDETDNHPNVVAFKQLIARSDASIWHSPEYNHSFTGVIKNAIDHLHDELRRKPIGTTGLSNAAHGGVRATEQLKLVLIELHALPIRESIHFAEARTLFDEQGALQRPEYIRRIDYFVADLAWYARTLRWGRATLPIPERPR